MKRATMYGVYAAVCLLLCGCGGEPYNYQQENELKPGPGLFSGPKGEFTIYGSSREEPMEGDRSKTKDGKTEN